MAAAGDLSLLAERADYSWMERLRADPEAAKHEPNRSSRQVRSGHYVPVKPLPLGAPRLVIHSPSMAASLGISEEEVQTDRFKAFFSGDIDQVEGFRSWATPYALSIMGQAYSSNCPFGNGNGYGDGRAISVGEVVVGGDRWEMQLKGGGPTPFCRRADGRAVLRSSIREFLASEAMFRLGVDTTRALSLVVSGEDTTQRPWYSEIREDDPRLAKFSEAERRAMLKQKRDPDMMVEEACAITTRVSPSFLRVGHFDLFTRRVVQEPDSAERREELELLLEHALFREYGDLDLPDGLPLEDKAAALLEAFGDRLAVMAAGWLRVGFCQGNFNADNCLVGGRTMDYGPFGFMDEYDPLFAKWTGSGRHYAFMNQPGAALANYATFAGSLMPLLGEGGGAKAQEAIDNTAEKIKDAVAATWRVKMGLPDTEAAAASAAELWEELEALMVKSKADYTLTWRQLAAALEVGGEPLAELADCFYAPLGAPVKTGWEAWLGKWRAAVAEHCAGEAAADVAARMRTVNPKYVPREWMLVEAYDAAITRGDESLVHELFALFEAPYDEQPDMEAKYYARAPDAALVSAGTAFMS